MEFRHVPLALRQVLPLELETSLSSTRFPWRSSSGRNPFSTSSRRFRRSAHHGRLTRCRKGLEEIVGLLKEKRLLIQDANADERLLARLRTARKTFHKGQLQLMYPGRFPDCNLRCTYCFVGQPENNTQQRMEAETARKAVAYFFRHSGGAPERRIIFYGGELAPESRGGFRCLGRVLSRHEKHLGKLELLLITNGLLLTRTVAEGLIQRGIKVSVSIDGPQDVHDAHRKTCAGGPTYNDAIRAFRLLQDLGATPSVSCTITPKKPRTLGRRCSTTPDPRSRR